MLLDSVLEAVGNTPLIRLKKMSSGNVFGKAEFLNPEEALKIESPDKLLNQQKKTGSLKPA